MITITPSSAPTPAGIPTSTPSAPTTAPNAVVTQLPSQLQNSGPGTVISGTVISRDSHGQTQLQTDAGVVTFKTSAQLSVGSQVTLQVQAAGSQLQAVVLSARAPTVAATTAAPASPTLTAAVTAGPSAPVVTSIGTGPVILATVIGPAGTPVPGLPTTAGGAAAPFPPIAGASLTPAGQSSTSIPGLAAQIAGTAATATGPSPASGFTPALPTTPGAGTPASLSPGTAAVAFAVANARPGSLPIPAATTPAAATPADVTIATVATPATRTAGAPTTQPPVQSLAATPAPATAASSAAATAPLVAAASAIPPSPVQAAAIARYAAVASTPLQQTGPVPAGNAPGLPGAPFEPTASLPRDAAASRPPLTIPAASAGTQLQVTYIGPTSTTVQPGVLVGAMRGHTPAGQAIFDTAIGRLALTLPAGVGTHPEGSLVAFQIMDVAARPAAGAAGLSVPPATRALTLGHEWPSLKAAIAVLAETDPPLARQIVDVSLPRPGHPRFLGQILSFIAMPAQDVRVLLGEAAASGLERAGRQDIILRLEGDLREAARLNASSNDWRMFFVPVVEANEMRQLRLFTRRRAPASGKDRDGGARFIVEVDFEELGPLQIDGLVQKPRIDLILRSHTELPQEMRAGIVGIFENTCGAAGLNGQIFFQAVPAFPVSPLDEMTKGARPGVEV